MLSGSQSIFYNPSHATRAKIVFFCVNVICSHSHQCGNLASKILMKVKLFAPRPLPQQKNSYIVLIQCIALLSKSLSFKS